MMKRIVCLLVVVLTLSSCTSSVIEREDEPDVFLVKETDKRMNDAMEKARNNIDKFISSIGDNRFNASMKVGFIEEDQTEHMWVTDVAYSDGTFSGILNNDPLYLSNYQFGDFVEISLIEISDWMLVDSDGKVKGGYTILVLIEDMSDEEREEFLDYSGLVFN